MSTITAILEPDATGSVRLPLPPELHHTPVKVTATVEPVSAAEEPPSPDSLKGFGCLRGKISMSPDFDEPLEDFKDYTG